MSEQVAGNLTLDELCKIVEDFKKPSLTTEAGVPCESLFAALGIGRSEVEATLLGIPVVYKDYLPPNTLVVKYGDALTVYMMGKDGKACVMEIPSLEESLKLRFTHGSP